MNDLDFLRMIVNTPAVEITKSERRRVSALAKAHGVTIKRRDCASCYVDAAVELFGLLSKEQETDTKCQSPKYVLRDGVDILYNGVRVNNATLTDAMADRLIADGFDRSLFV